jgi:FHA domain
MLADGGHGRARPRAAWIDREDPSVPSGPALRVGRRLLPLHRTVSLVGRSIPAAGHTPDLDLGPDDAERRVSRRHAELSCRPGATELTDLGSGNGTFRNGVRLEPHTACPLEDGDRLLFGTVSAGYLANAPWPDGLVAEWAGSGAEAPVPAVEDRSVTLIGHRGAVLREVAEAPRHKRRRLLPIPLWGRADGDRRR